VAREEADGALPQDVRVYRVYVEHNATPEEAGGPWPQDDLHQLREHVHVIRDVVFDEQAQWD
jgi:hypothetical protein